MLEVAGLALSAVQTLLAALQRPELNNIRSIVEYKSQLDALKGTVETLESVLLDVEIKQELLSHQDKVQINKIKDAVYEADDLFDEFVTLAQQKQLMKADGRVSENFRSFFSLSSNPLSVAYRMSHGVKKIKKKLDAITYNKQFSFNHDPQPIRNRRPDTCSYVNEVQIIGRDDELEEIVEMLLGPSNDQSDDVSFLSIVGIGGLGKTALAQLVFNNPRVKSAFSWSKWICVADQDQKQLDVKEVLCKILGQNHDESYMEEVQTTIRKQLAGQRYLLVLDDVWTENRNQWCDLVEYLIGGQRGSWILLTTRSQKTATIVGGQMYELQGLSKKNSWHLFERTAFTPHQSSNPPDELVKIGQKIVDRCARVPLAIRVAGSLLYGQDKGKWMSVQEIGLANIRESENGILPILKLSFHHLESPLKSCFSYCALFPKDFVMEKEKLKSLWMAQGYIIPLDIFQSTEDACEEYFSILLKRCFFQDVLKDYSGEIITCKIHDLMHDIALDVLGKEIFDATNIIRYNLNKNVRHLFIASMREHGNYSLVGKTHIRSYLISHIIDVTQFPVEAIVANCRFLRALDLRRLKIKSLSGCIGELLHLRYLDLSYSTGLQVLPKSFTRLYNLQTLILKGCWSLRELPKDLSRLVKLRLLDVRDCDSLTYMPKGMGKLSCLHWLSDYMVGGGGSSSSWKQWFDSLEDLKALNKLKGWLNIWIRWPKKDRNNVKEDNDVREGLYMRNKEHLNELQLVFIHEEGDDGGKDEEFSLMEDLQPHSNLKHLIVKNYIGVKMPCWLSLLPNIVHLYLFMCSELEYLPCMRNLRHLKFIQLSNLENLEYIEVDDPSKPNSSSPMPMSGLGSCDKELSFLPSLESVVLADLPKLKGWKRGVVGRIDDNNSGNNLQSQSQQLLTCLPQVKSLYIYKCLELTCLPSCPGLEDLSLEKYNEGLQIIDTKRDEVAPASSSASTSGYEILNPKLQRVNWVGKEKVDLPNWMQFLPALEHLTIRTCRTLKAIPNWMPKLTSLTTLKILGCSESLQRRCQKDPPGEDWLYIQHIPDIDIKAW